MSNGFQRVLSHIRSIAGTEAEKSRLFERLMKAYFRQDPLYGDRFSDVRHRAHRHLQKAPEAHTRRAARAHLRLDAALPHHPPSRPLKPIAAAETVGTVIAAAMAGETAVRG